MDASGSHGHADPPWVPVPGMSPSEQAEMFGSIAMSSPVAVVVSDLEARIIWVNPVAERLFGWRRDQLLGQRMTVLVPPETHDRILQIRARILSGEHTTPFLAKGQRRDGGTFDVSATPGVRRDAAGRPLGTNMMLRDVTEELRVQRELADALARSRARFDQSAKPQALLDVDGRFVEVNDAGLELLGWTRAEVIGRPATDLVHPSDADLVRQRLEQLLHGTLRSATYDTVGVHKDGRRVPLQVDITAVRDAHGRAYEFAASARDLTELREARQRLQRQEAFFRALNRETSDVTMVVDADGSLVYVTPSITQILGYRPEDLVDVLGEELGHPDDLHRVMESRLRARRPGARERFEIRLCRADGAWHWFHATLTNLLEDPDVNGMVINLRDIAAEVAAQQALRESEARFRAIAETAMEGIAAVSPEGEILFANERLTEILDLTLEEVHRFLAEGLFYRGEGGATTRRLVRHPPVEGAASYDLEYDHPRKGRRVLAVSASALWADHDRLLGTLGMVSDVTEQRTAEARLKHQALHDALTGLPNRVLFADRLAMAAARQRRDGDSRGVAVLFLDLDDFKRVNDTHGHDVGDQVLGEVARRVAGSVRAADTVARLGGDELAVICEATDAASAVEVADRIRKALEAPVEVAGLRLSVDASVGVAVAPPHPVEDLLRLADRAMYLAKGDPARAVVVWEE